MNKIRIVLIPAHYDNILDVDGWFNTGSNLGTQLESRQFTQEEDLKNYIKNFISAISCLVSNSLYCLCINDILF